MGFTGKNTGVGCHFLLQGIFLTQGSNLLLLLGRRILYHWATRKAHYYITSILYQVENIPNVSPSLYLCFFHQFSSVAQLCPILCDPMDCSTPGFPVHHHLLELSQTHLHWVSDAIQPSHPLLSPSPPAFNLSQHQGLFQWVSSSHQVAKVLEFQLQHQSFQWIFWTNFPLGWTYQISLQFLS